MDTRTGAFVLMPCPYDICSPTLNLMAEMDKLAAIELLSECLVCEAAEPAENVSPSWEREVDPELSRNSDNDCNNALKFGGKKYSHC